MRCVDRPNNPGPGRFQDQPGPLLGLLQRFLLGSQLLGLVLGPLVGLAAQAGDLTPLRATIASIDAATDAEAAQTLK